MYIIVRGCIGIKKHKITPSGAKDILFVSLYDG